jgi:hypothetical protein
MGEIRFPKDELPDLEAYSESITLQGSLTILEDDYEQTTIWRRKISTQSKPIYIKTRIEKLADVNMVVMYDFIRKHCQGRFYRKPRDMEEFMADIMEYFTRGQIRRYNQDWEDILYKTHVKLDPDQERGRWTTKERIENLKKQGISLEDDIKEHTKNMAPKQA